VDVKAKYQCSVANFSATTEEQSHKFPKTAKRRNEKKADN
jgi:hypothetical protein